MPDHECQHRQDIVDIKNMVKDIHDKLYIGNGQPPITVQIDRLNMFRKLSIWVGGVLFVSVAGLVARLIYTVIAG